MKTLIIVTLTTSLLMPFSSFADNDITPSTDVKNIASEMLEQTMPQLSKQLTVDLSSVLQASINTSTNLVNQVPTKLIARVSSKNTKQLNNADE